MHVYVNKNDILRGVKRDGNKCPIALAVKRMSPKHSIFVAWNVVRMFHPIEKAERIAIIPLTVRRWMRRFDIMKKKNIEPIQFRLNFQKWDRE